jgi:hypothetical protein
MYEPVFNSVLVEIDDKDAQWGSGNDESMMGKAYRMGKIIRIADVISNEEHPIDDAVAKDLNKLKGKQVMWNEGVEAGTTFEFDGKLFGMIYWWDIRGVKVNET